MDWYFYNPIACPCHIACPCPIFLSYSWMTNQAKEISSHNNKILNEAERNTDPPGCNCRRIECPLEKHCLVPCCVYQVLLSSSPTLPTYNYFGQAGNTFKERYQGHKLSFEDSNYRGSTTLSAKLWSSRTKVIPFSWNGIYCIQQNHTRRV